MRTDVLILGGGLAGLSTAYHLEKFGRRGRYILAEKSASPGGKAGSRKINGFTFDYTGHLLHLHDPYGKKLILDLLKGNTHLLTRNAWIYSHKVFTRYPFQANTYGLPQNVIAECVAGFVKNLYRPSPIRNSDSFHERCMKIFGAGISKHFMIPYNEKLWRIGLRDLTTEWQGRFIPRPKPEEVLYGALTDQRKFFGYNAHFRYPKKGGCQALPDALAARIGGLYLNSPVRAVHLRDKVAEIEGLGEVRYERLVNTMPLPKFIDLCTGLDTASLSARRKLRWVDVHNLNIGIRRPRISDKHWVYFPEKRFPFYRAGFSSNFSPDLAPKGTSSMYIEVSRRPGETVDRPRLQKACVDGLKSSGLLKRSDKLAAVLWNHIECAYVVYDVHRTAAVNTLLKSLRRRGVNSIGRWGSWHYSFMEETLLEGKRCAEQLCGRRTISLSSDKPLSTLK